MQTIILGTLTAFFESYLALTTGVADFYYRHFPLATPPSAETRSLVDMDVLTLTKVASTYEPVPPILIENTTAQSASVANSTFGSTATTSVTAATVNIFCTYESDTKRHATTGSGFFIHDSGVILTNAHVAQTLLLETVRGESNCVVRTGSPAEPTYEAELLYISTAWVMEHAAELAKAVPKGTGERDFALLYVTDTLMNEPMPARFPALALDLAEINTRNLDRSVRVGGYPASSSFRNNGIDGTLAFKTASTSITELLTFGSQKADIFSVSGTSVGEQGVSGGPVVSTTGIARGIVSTLGDQERFGPGSLRALTLSYIDRTIKEETTRPLLDHANGNLPFQARVFKETMVPFLQNVLTDAGVE